jgi:membrane associated rhomboid family serine protease
MAYRGSRPVAVWTIIGINLVVFIATIIDPNIILLLGLQPASFLAHPWTIVTNMFVHSSLWHILANMITFYFFGSFLYHLVGRNRFLVVYFAGGVLGNIFYILLASSPISIAIGASGAIFAVAGALVMMMPRLRVLL